MDQPGHSHIDIHIHIKIHTQCFNIRPPENSMQIKRTALVYRKSAQSINQSIKTLIHVDRPQRAKVHMVKIKIKKYNDTQ